MTYSPMKVTGISTGLVKNREEFILPNDAYPVLENAYVWRERILRKKGCELLGRLRRVFTNTSIGNTGASPWTFTLYSVVTPAITESNAEIEPGSLVIVIGGVITLTDQGNGTLTSVTPGNSGVVNYISGSVTVTHTAGAGVATVASFNYFPSLPVMGLRTRELTSTNNEMMVAWDTVYAYRFGANGFQEFSPGTTWTGTDSNFFWTTNYWVTPFPANNKLFWVTNFSGTTGDPIYYTDGPSSAWVAFSPTINAAGDTLNQCLVMLPFRGRMVTFNTFEGPTLMNSGQFRQRIRWAAIGNPISDISALFPLLANTNPNAWRDDIRGQGGFLDIPTSEDIVAVGFVRDNLVIYCERSTWQLRYTGRSIAPFQIEKVNTELGAESTFSAIQFDTSLVGIGDKGVVECDSYQSRRIDVKIPDLVFQFNNDQNGTERVYGIRDQQQKLVYWTYPYQPDMSNGEKYPNRRLIYNYENDSWAIFTDSFTCFGTYQSQSGRTWQNTKIPWEECNFPWAAKPSLFPSIMAGNQQGYVEYVGGNLEGSTANDITLSITAIQGNAATLNPTVITSPNHNMDTGTIIKIKDIPTGTPFDNLNDNVFQITIGDLTGTDPLNKFYLSVYDPNTLQFSTPQLDASATYIGGGQIAVRDNFSIVSKKFNFIDEGRNIQIGYIDMLMSTTDDGAITLNVFQNYNDTNPVNQPPENSQLDLFFNANVPTTSQGGIESTKQWQRIFCPTQGQFLTLQFTLSNEQMSGNEQQNDLQIDAQIIWLRKAGKNLPIGV